MGKFFIPSMPTLVCALISPAIILVGIDLELAALVVLGMLFAIIGFVTFWLDWLSFCQEQRFEDEIEALNDSILRQEIQNAEQYAQGHCITNREEQIS